MRFVFVRKQLYSLFAYCAMLCALPLCARISICNVRPLLTMDRPLAVLLHCRRQHLFSRRRGRACVRFSCNGVCRGQIFWKTNYLIIADDGQSTVLDCTVLLELAIEPTSERNYSKRFRTYTSCLMYCR